jgi:hypothetical protein
MAKTHLILICGALIVAVGCRQQQPAGSAQVALKPNDGDPVGGPMAGIRGPCDSPHPHYPDSCYYDDVQIAAENFVKRNPEVCPTISQLKSLKYLNERALTTDLWDRAFLLECSEGIPLVFTAGQDGETGTEDDYGSSRFNASVSP